MFLLWPLLASAQLGGPRVKITLEAGGQVSFVAPAIQGADHLHLLVDGEPAGSTRAMQGRFTISAGQLSPGAHRLCIEVANRAHVPITDPACVEIQSK
jgi:hypothetical protein